MEFAICSIRSAQVISHLRKCSAVNAVIHLEDCESSETQTLNPLISVYPLPFLLALGGPILFPGR